MVVGYVNHSCKKKTLVKGYVISPQVLLGLLSVWNVSFLGYPARVRNSISLYCCFRL
jgi:hypothetical protein